MEERGSWKTLGNGQLFCRILQEYMTLLHSCILFNWVFPWIVPAIQGRLWATLSQSSVLPRHISTVSTDAVRDLVGGWQLAGKDGGCHGTQWTHSVFFLSSSWPVQMPDDLAPGFSCVGIQLVFSLGVSFEIRWLGSEWAQGLLL